MSKAISLKDKRLLAKFIQFIGDSVASSEQDAKAVNDIELKQGRSLSRPQNKSVLKIDLHAYDTVPFVEFLEKEFQITGVLKDMIMYCFSSLLPQLFHLSLGLRSHVPHGLASFGSSFLLTGRIRAAAHARRHPARPGVHHLPQHLRRHTLPVSDLRPRRRASIRSAASTTSTPASRCCRRKLSA